MTYRTVMVGLDGAPTCAARTEVAIHLAQDFDAHLIGIAPTGMVDLPTAPGAAALLGDYAASAWPLLIEKAEEAADQFRARCEAARLPSFEAVTDEGPVAASLASRAHCTDLLVMSQPDPAQAGYRYELSTLEQVLLHGARPTLLVPYTHHGPLRMRRMLIGWDESREAVRAMLDLNAVAVARRLSHLPVLVNPSLAAGQAEIVPDLALAATATGCEGVLLDVDTPDVDGAVSHRQALTVDHVTQLVPRLKRTRAAIAG